jgi:hypothetical protein
VIPRSCLMGGAWVTPDSSGPPNPAAAAAQTASRTPAAQTDRSRPLLARIDPLLAQDLLGGLF